MVDTNELKNGFLIDDLILYSDLNWYEKTVLSDICNICKDDDAVYYKLNQTIADMMRLSTKSISRVMSSLKEKGLISLKISHPYKNIKAMRRITPIYINIKKLSINNNSPINK
jgi:tRNA G26 N,N-dimethylase Trm1